MSKKGPKKVQKRSKKGPKRVQKGFKRSKRRSIKVHKGPKRSKKGPKTVQKRSKKVQIIQKRSKKFQKACHFYLDFTTKPQEKYHSEKTGLKGIWRFFYLSFLGLFSAFFWIDRLERRELGYLWNSSG